jgi:hypothetical protein
LLAAKKAQEPVPDEAPTPDAPPQKVFLPVLWQPPAKVHKGVPKPEPLPEVIILGPPQVEPEVAVPPWAERVAKVWAGKPRLRPDGHTPERLEQLRAHGFGHNVEGGYCRSQDRHSDCIMRATEHIVSMGEVERIRQEGRKTPIVI